MNSHSAAESSAPSGGICSFEKWLSVWVALSIAAGIDLGSVVLKIRINLFNGGNAGCNDLSRQVQPSCFSRFILLSTIISTSNGI